MTAETLCAECGGRWPCEEAGAHHHQAGPECNHREDVCALAAELQDYRDLWLPLSKRYNLATGEAKTPLKGFAEYQAQTVTFITDLQEERDRQRQRSDDGVLILTGVFRRVKALERYVGELTGDGEAVQAPWRSIVIAYERAQEADG